MARALDIGGLEEILNRLRAQALLTVRMAVEVKCREKLEEAKRAVLEETREKLAALDLTLEDVLPARSGRTGDRRPRWDAGRTLPVKYRGPEGQTWSGRGHVPNWLQTLEDQGHNREEFKVDEKG